MKNIYLCIIILTLISCSTDPSLHLEEVSNFSENLERTGAVLPNNSDNPYDYSGEVYTELFDAYFSSKLHPTTISGIINSVDSLAAINLKFQFIKEFDYQSVSESRVNYILENKNTCLSDVIESATLSNAAKVSLASFVNSFIVFYDLERNDTALYNFVLKYESEINESVILNESDQIQLLTITSIVRQAACRATKRPKKNTDPDWDILIANIAGGIEGSSTSASEAITLSLIYGISQNTLSSI